MTLTEIEEFVTRSQVAGFSDIEYRTETGTLRIRLALSPGLETGTPSNSRPVPGEILASVRAQCAGVFMAAHPMMAHGSSPAKAAVISRETIGFLKIGPCLRAVEAPLSGALVMRNAVQNRLVGYGEILFDI